MNMELFLSLMWNSISRGNPALEPAAWKIHAARLFEAALKNHGAIMDPVDWACGALLDIGSAIAWPPVQETNGEFSEGAQILWKQCLCQAFEAGGWRAGTCRRQAHDQGGRLGQFLLGWAHAVCAYKMGTGSQDSVRTGQLLALRYGGDSVANFRLLHQQASRVIDDARASEIDAAAIKAFGSLTGWAS